MSRVLKQIGEVQNMFDRCGAMKKSLPHLASRNDEIAKEVLAFLCIMLFNANTQVQVGDYTDFTLLLQVLMSRCAL